MGRAQGTHDVQPRGGALAADAGAHGLEAVHAGQVLLHQVGQGQVLEHEVEELLLGDLEDEVVLALAGVAGLALAGTAATAAGGPRDALAGGELLVAGVDDGLPAAAAMVQHRLVDVARGDADLLAVLHVGDRAPADGLLHRLLDVVAVPSQEALAVHRALVLAVQSSVDDVTHGVLRCGLEAGGAARSVTTPAWRSGLDLSLEYYCDLRTRRYHSASRRTCFSV
ncbi:hypothetical protein D3C86_1433140 [compost metagenome]